MPVVSIISSFNALNVAICFNHPGCVRVLIDHGADIAQGGVWKTTTFRNALHLDQMARDGELMSGYVKSRGDELKKILEEKARTLKPGERTLIIRPK